jgi:hypothetical protein
MVSDVLEAKFEICYAGQTPTTRLKCKNRGGETDFIKDQAQNTKREQFGKRDALGVH